MPPKKTIARRYEVLDEIGAGGISTVFKVLDSESGKTVALKRVEPTRTSDEEIARFHREFRFLSEIAHPNIVRVFETGVDGQLPFFTMEYLAGETLADALARPDRGYALTLRRDPAALTDFLTQVCHALSHIHGQGTVHRDLKPSNLMVTPNGSVPDLKVLDLGLAKFRHTDPGVATRSAQVLGTVHYSAPEQIKGTTVDGRADLYSLGAILYEIMTGRRPFSGDNAVSVAVQQLNELPVPPRVHDLDVPHHIQLAIMKLLEKDPDRRYRTPEDLLIDLGNPDVIAIKETETPSAPPLLLHPRFLGRREQAAQARGAMSDIRSGAGRILAVEGEAGIGKTRFLNEICADAKVMGIQILGGTCYRDSPTPYRPVIDAVREGLGERSLWNWVDRDDRFPLARLFPELKDESVEAIPEEYQMVKQDTIVEALVRLLERAGRGAPIILSLDDLQWADEPTLAFLAALSDRVKELPVAVLAGHRPFEGTSPAGLEDADRIRLTPLDRDTTRDLVGSILGSLDVQEELLTEVYTVSGGNPFSAIEAVRSLEDNGTLRWKRNQWHYAGLGNDLPERVEWLVNQRITRLSGPRREILELATLLGRPFDIPFLELCGLENESAIRKDLHWLISHDLLKVADDDRYQLFHANVESAVTAALEKDRTADLHLRIGLGLEHAKGDPEEIGRHFLESPEPVRAIEPVLAAAEVMHRQCAHAAEVRWVERLLEVVRESATDSQTARILLMFAEAARQSGEKAKVQKCARELAALRLDGALEIERDLEVLRLEGDAEVAGKTAEQLVAAAKAFNDDALALKCCLKLIQSKWSTGDEKGAERAHAEALQYVPDEAPFHQGFLSFLQGNQYLERFFLRRARAHFETAIRCFRGVGHVHLETYASIQLAETLFYSCEYSESQATLRHLRTGSSAFLSSQKTYVEMMLHVFGGTELSSTEIDFQSFNTIRSSPNGCVMCALSSVVFARQGERAKSTRHAKQAITLSNLTPSKRSATLRVLGETYIVLGDLPKAVATFRESVEAAGTNELQKQLSSLRLGSALIDLGNVNESRPLISGFIEFCRGREAQSLAKQAEDLLRKTESLVSTPSIYNGIHPSLLDEILNSAVGSLRCERAVLALFEDISEPPKLISSNLSQAEDAETISHTIIRTTLIERKKTVTNDASSDPRFAENASIVDHDIRSIVCVPITNAGDVQAALYVDHRGVNYFSDRDIAYLESFADLAGVTLDRSTKYEQLKENLDKLTDKKDGYPNLIGDSPGMRAVYSLLSRVCETDIPVLLVGETGTGKGLVARTIHQNSPRAPKPFLSQNCGALNLELLETELFGHARGSFTGADTAREGLFEAADGGTIFLDEIGDAPEAVQIRLLQAIEEGTIRRVGENENREVNVRVVAATHRDLEEEVSKGRFREDLYYRLRVIPIRIPTLRERREDIPALAHHFLRTCSEDFGWNPGRMSAEVLAAFEAYDWPGNVRELENEIRRGLTLAGDGERIEVRHLSERLGRPQLPLPSDVGELKDAVASYEGAYISSALDRQDWNVTRTAEQLGLTRVTLQRKIKKLGLKRPT